MIFENMRGGQILGYKSYPPHDTRDFTPSQSLNQTELLH